MDQSSQTLSINEKDAYINELTRKKFNDIDSRIFNSFKKYNDISKRIITNDKPELTGDRLSETTKLSSIINLINNTTFSDKLKYVSLISRDLYFYSIESNKINTIKLDNNIYKAWCDLISSKSYDNLFGFINFHSKILFSCDYKYFMEKIYNNDNYTLDSFKQEYIFKKIVNYNIQTKTYDSTITKTQINDYKNKIKSQIIYGKIKTYTIVDFILAIIKYKTDIINVNTSDVDDTIYHETFFDIYYMYFKSLNIN